MFDFMFLYMILTYWSCWKSEFLLVPFYCFFLCVFCMSYFTETLCYTYTCMWDLCVYTYTCMWDLPCIIALLSLIGIHAIKMCNIVDTTCFVYGHVHSACVLIIYVTARLIKGVESQTASIILYSVTSAHNHTVDSFIFRSLLFRKSLFTSCSAPHFKELCKCMQQTWLNHKMKWPWIPDVPNLVKLKFSQKWRIQIFFLACPISSN